MPRKIDDWNTSISYLLKPIQNPLLVVLQSKEDGDKCHAVTILDEWIFDSSLAYALPLNQEALSFVCGDNHTCARVIWG